MVTGNEEPLESPRRGDLGVTVVLIIIWVAGLAFVTARRPEIPRSMLLIGTIFFIVLIPAMKDLVRTIEKRLGTSNPAGTE